MTSWTGSRIQALSLHRKVGSDGWLPTRGLMSRENFPFFMLYAWALQKVSVGPLAACHDVIAAAPGTSEEGRSRAISVFLPVIPHGNVLPHMLYEELEV